MRWLRAATGVCLVAALLLAIVAAGALARTTAPPANPSTLPLTAPDASGSTGATGPYSTSASGTRGSLTPDEFVSDPSLDGVYGWVMRVIIRGVFNATANGGGGGAGATASPLAAVSRAFLSRLSSDVTFHGTTHHLSAPLLSAPFVGADLTPAATQFAFDTAANGQSTVRLQVVVAASASAVLSGEDDSATLHADVGGAADWYSRGGGVNASEPDPFGGPDHYSPCTITSGVLDIPLLTSTTEPPLIVGGGGGGGGDPEVPSELPAVPTPYVLRVELQFDPVVGVCAAAGRSAVSGSAGLRGGASVVQRGTSQPVRWNAALFAPAAATSPSTQSWVQLALCRRNPVTGASDPDFAPPLCRPLTQVSIPNTGSYAWNVPAEYFLASQNVTLRALLTDCYVTVRAAASPANGAPALAPEWADVAARSTLFTLIAPLPDASRGVEEVMILRPSRVDSFANGGVGLAGVQPNAPFTDNTNFYVKLSFGALDTRVAPLQFAYTAAGTPAVRFTPPAQWCHFVSSNSDGAAQPRLTVAVHSDANTAANPPTSLVATVTRTDVRTGFLGGSDVALALTLGGAGGGVARFTVAWSAIVYRPVRTTTWTIDPRGAGGGGDGGGDSNEGAFSISWIPQALVDPQALATNPQLDTSTLSVRIAIVNRAVPGFEVVLAARAPNTGTYTFRTRDYYGTSGNANNQPPQSKGALPVFPDSNQYVVRVDALAPFTRVLSGGADHTLALNMTSRSDTFIIRNPDVCRIPSSPCSSNATCTLLTNSQNNQGNYANGNGNDVSYGFLCRCRAGYAGSDPTTQCLDINECATNNGGCDPMVTCVNTVGARLCGPCPSAYAASPVGCQLYNPDQPCLRFQCGTNAHCDVTTTAAGLRGGMPVCSCDDGYEFDDTDTQCLSSDGSDVQASTTTSSGRGSNSLDSDSELLVLIVFGALIVMVAILFAFYRCWERQRASQLPAILAREREALRQFANPALAAGAVGGSAAGPAMIPAISSAAPASASAASQSEQKQTSAQAQASAMVIEPAPAPRDPPPTDLLLGRGSDATAPQRSSGDAGVAVRGTSHVPRTDGGDSKSDAPVGDAAVLPDALAPLTAGSPTAAPGTTPPGGSNAGVAMSGIVLALSEPANPPLS